MKITKKWLTGKNACADAVEAWEKHGKESDPETVVRLAMERARFDWANWLIVRCMKYRQYVAYAIFAAEQVIDIYEQKYPNDKIPRKAIKAAKACLINPSKKNKAVAAYAAAAAAAAYAATAAYAAAAAATYAATVAATAAAAAATAYAATAAATYAAAAATYGAAAAARKDMCIKIIEYGISLLK